VTAHPSAGDSPSMPFAMGEVLAGKYRIERLLGEGGMGWVVVATHLHLEQRVAMKFMRASRATDDAEAVARFLREARAAARIQSEHVARVSDFGTLESGAPYLVMEYLEGQDLEALLRDRGALSCDLAVDYALQACEGLAEAHAAGIVHRDLKPANLFLARRSDGSVRVKLLDFGISKLAAAAGAPEAAMTSTQTLMGSPLYMAPEQMRSSKNVDGRADIWSMGVILFEMLGGRPPFDGDTLPAVCARIMTEAPPSLRALRAGVPPGLEAVVARCLEKEPKQRFADVAALVRAIAPFGGPDARSTAERIGRVTRASMVSMPDAPVESREAHVRVNRIAQTSATFTSTGGDAPPRRRAVVPLAIAGGVLLGAAVFAAVTAVRSSTRGPSAPPLDRSAAAAASPSPSPRAPASAPSPLPSPGPVATASLAPLVVASPAGPATQGPPPGASPVPTATATGAPPRAFVAPPPPPTPTPPNANANANAAGATGAAAGGARTQARGKPAPGVPKPAATSGFGGRD
jgi:serine/threonine protein kinase